MQNPGKPHWEAVKHILRYLQGTESQGIRLGGTHRPLHAFVDANWANDLDTRRSCTGYIFFLNDGPIFWHSKLQSTIAQSSTEAEYMALTSGANEASWLRNLLQSLGHIQSEPTVLLGDNQGSIKLAHNPQHHARTKHIDVRHHDIRELVANNHNN